MRPDQLFNLGLKWLDMAEGGFTVDTGGATFRGVTQTVYDAYRRDKKLEPRSVSDLTVGEWEDVIRTRYWALAGCDKLPERTAIAVLDFAFNSGPLVAVKHLQRVLKFPEDEQDGIFGPETLKRVQEYLDGALATKYLDDHRAFYQGLVTKFPKKYRLYAKGWDNRIQNLRQFLIKELP